MKLGIVEDNTLNRKIIKEKLLPYEGIQLVLEAENGEDFFEKINETPKENLPEIVLIDLEMPIMDGISTISISKIKFPEIKFIVLTIYEDVDKIFEAIKAGANGYLLKEDKAVNIVEALNNVMDYDGIPMSPAIARKAMNLLKSSPKPETENQETETMLSDREMQILKEIVNGKNHTEIGERLFISPNTVRTHVNNIYKKLHLNSRTQIVNLAYKNKWI